VNIIGGAEILSKRFAEREGRQGVFLDGASNFHPYECNGPGWCIHCDRLVTPNHDPEHCALCQWPDGEEHDVTQLQDAVSKLKEIAAALGALDFSQEIDQINEAVASIQGELEDVARKIQGIEPGEDAPEPSGVENVDLAEAEAAAAAEETEPGAEPVEEEPA